MRVFVTHNPEDLDAYFGRALKALHEAGIETELNPLDRDLSTEELIEHAADCDVIIAHRSTPGEAGLFERSERLLAILRTAVDISTIDVAAASANGVLVGHADKSFVPSTAELALGLLLDSARHIADSTVDYRNDPGRQPAQRPGRQLRGQTAGIIGLGAIGSYLAEVLQALGMRVVVHDPFVRTDIYEQVAVLDDLLRQSDVVFPLAQASAETHHLINADAISVMKPGGRLINVSRGELVDEAAVSAALSSGQLGGFATDVGSAPDQRPAPELASMDGVVATPHLGGLTPENAVAQAMSAVDQVKALIAGNLPPRIVNADSGRRLTQYRER